MNMHMNLPMAANNWGLTPAAKSAMRQTNNSPKGSDPNWLAAGGKFCPLVQAMLVVALGVSGFGVRAEVDYTGEWFICTAKNSRGERYPYHFLEITKNETGQLVWEKTVYKSRDSGVAYPSKTQLKLYGCGYFTDELQDKCDEKNPPLSFTLQRSFFLNATTNSSEKILMSGRAIRLSRTRNHERQAFTSKMIDLCENLGEQVWIKKNQTPKKHSLITSHRLSAASSQLGSDPFAPLLAFRNTPLAFGVRPQLFVALGTQI